MDKLPFTVYDFFAYLSSGFVVLVSITASFVGYEPLKEAPGFILAVLFVVAAYVTGHIVANVSGDLIERRLVRERLGMPTEHLLGSEAAGIRRKLFPGFYSSLPSATQQRVFERAAGRGFAGEGEALFFHCHALMKREDVVQARLNTFLNLYGFCRNMTMALVIAAVSLGVGVAVGSADTGPDVGAGWWILAALVAALGMLYRYLKFLRQYGVELFTSYAEAG